MEGSGKDSGWVSGSILERILLWRVLERILGWIMGSILGRFVCAGFWRILKDSGARSRVGIENMDFPTAV